MRQDERAPFHRALHRARVSAYPPGEFAEQESFMRAGEILDLARRAGIAPGMFVLDLCCGVAGPGRLITQELGCAYLGLDYSPSAINIARERAHALPCRFEVAQIPPIPQGPFDVVLLLETMLAFQDKDALVEGVARALTPGGRFAFTLEAGPTLTEAERESMPDADTVWLTPLEEMRACLERAGLVVRWQDDCSASHRATAQALAGAFAADAEDIAAEIGRHALDELLAAHRLWTDWLADGRVRKFAFVAEKAGPRTVAESGAGSRPSLSRHPRALAPSAGSSQPLTPGSGSAAWPGCSSAWFSGSCPPFWRASLGAGTTSRAMTARLHQQV